MSDLVDVGAVEDFDDGAFRVLEAKGRQVGVARWSDRFFALRNICPHQAGPLCVGRLLPGVRATDAVGSHVIDPAEPVVTCPWHGWEFSLASGRAVVNARYRVRAYDVMVRDGRVLLEMG